VLGPLEVVYQDFTGSGAETAAHAREIGRIVVISAPNDPAVCISPVEHRVAAFPATAGWRVGRQPLPICPERSHAGF
jgi:hypothetical protein